MRATSLVPRALAVVLASLGVATAGALRPNATINAKSDAAAGATPLDPALRRAIDSVFAPYDRLDSPGCNLGVIRDGRLVYQRGYGMASLEQSVPIGAETVFDIGSTSKQFTATSIVLLAQRGKLSIDDEVQKYIPELPRYQAPVTIRHLLTHTSGIRDYIGLMVWEGFRIEDVSTAADALEAITRQRALNFTPGSEYLYSNSGYFLLGQIVERVSKQRLKDFARENIFLPLEMHDTQILDDHLRVIAHKAGSYDPISGGGWAINMSNWEQTGDGAVQTTVADLAKWDANFYSAKVGGRTLVDTLQHVGTLTTGAPMNYAMGLMVDHWRGVRRVAHGGSWAAFTAELLRFPDQRASVITLCNSGSASAPTLAQRVADRYLPTIAQLQPEAPAEKRPPRQADTAAAGSPLSAADLARVAGTYYSPELDVTWTLAPVNGGLVLRQRRNPESKLEPRGADTFRAPGLTLHIEHDQSGEVSGFTISAGRVRGIRFARKP